MRDVKNISPVRKINVRRDQVAPYSSLIDKARGEHPLYG